MVFASDGSVTGRQPSKLGGHRYPGKHFDYHTSMLPVSRSAGSTFVYDDEDIHAPVNCAEKDFARDCSEIRDYSLILPTIEPTHCSSLQSRDTPLQLIPVTSHARTRLPRAVVVRRLGYLLLRRLPLFGARVPPSRSSHFGKGGEKKLAGERLWLILGSVAKELGSTAAWELPTLSPSSSHCSQTQP
jgi:hypothetical protein